MGLLPKELELNGIIGGHATISFENMGRIGNYVGFY